MKIVKSLTGLVMVPLMVAAFQAAGWAADMPGVTDKEIKIGNTMPYSGPGSPYGTIGHAIGAYFKMVNAQGGVNGRTINFITYDDGYNIPKTVEQIRRLVEQDEVAFVYAPLGTAANTAIWEYLNSQKVPQLFLLSGASKFGDPKGHPWSMGFAPTYQTEGKIYAHYILTNIPDPKIGILYQNDDYGKEYVTGFKAGLGTKAAQFIVKELSYEAMDPTVDSQIVALKASGANVFFNVTQAKFAAMAIRKASEIGWKPAHFLNNVSASVGAVLTPAGLDKSEGIVTALYLKDPTDPQWRADADFKAWTQWMREYYPSGSVNDVFNAFSYASAFTMHQVLLKCGNDLSRENIMKRAANIKDLAAPMLLPGIKIDTAPDDFYPIEQLRQAKFDGQRWVLFGDVIDGRTVQ